SSTSALRWEVGAVSECGIREWNEDSYLIASNLQDALNTKGGYETVWRDDENHQAGLFALFDGHLGNHAARFAAEKLPQFIYDEVEGILRQSLLKLDNEFCKLCSQDGRDWESGATALVAALVNEHLVVANLGDCRGVVDSGRSRRCLWKQVSEDHSPLRVDEKKRIEDANGWITTWECPLHLIYPVNHSHRFSHDLVSNVPDFQTIRIGGKGISDEFLVLACDGLWDVMDADDAIRVTRDLLFERCWSAKKAAARLAQLAIHLGSSDNITVIVVRFFNREN
ncbi:predicted protein, partial [Phaeodactylum tricornutum CCAP 1055/1]